MDGVGAIEVSFLAEKLLTIDSCWESIFFSDSSPCAPVNDSTLMHILAVLSGFSGFKKYMRFGGRKKWLRR